MERGGSARAPGEVEGTGEEPRGGEEGDGREGAQVRGNPEGAGCLQKHPGGTGRGTDAAESRPCRRDSGQDRAVYGPERLQTQAAGPRGRATPEGRRDR